MRAPLVTGSATLKARLNQPGQVDATAADLADAIRFGARLATDIADTAVRTAITSLAIALDGYDARSIAGELARPVRFPFAAFDATSAAFDVGDVPADFCGVGSSMDVAIAVLSRDIARQHASANRLPNSPSGTGPGHLHRQSWA